ncbi:MAG: hypothetical protein EAZ99_06215 [Alphaproteobacteria bacterium]|nr:MAG: hypothetical protein EAZ99_06215 [Alphaproteobacteria bacterium]
MTASTSRRPNPARPAERANRTRVAEAMTARFATDAEHSSTKGRIQGVVLNVRPDPVDFRDLFYQASLVDLPTQILPPSLAAIGLEVRNQGTEGSCTGQALAAVIDLQNIHRFQAGAAVPRQVSARMLYESARLFDEFPDDGIVGSSARGAIKGFFNRGVCGSDLAPYFPGDLTWTLTVEQAKAARSVALGAYFRLSHVLNDYHAALAETKALFCTTMVHDGWSHESVARNGNVIRAPSGDPKQATLQGAHAVAIVGYTPEGFIVLNSWGSGWGGAPQPGMALWPYADWAETVLDAWVLRLQVPTTLPSGFVGGHLASRGSGKRSSDATDRARAPLVSEVLGHVINVKDGLFQTRTRYGTSLETLKETADLLQSKIKDTPRHYNHLLFFAHGGLNNANRAAERASALIPAFKRNGIYPMFYLWNTGLLSSLMDVLSGLFQSQLTRAQGITSDPTDALLEAAARTAVRPIWREIKADAQRSFASDGNGGAAWDATKVLAEAVAPSHPNGLKIHLVGMSAGAIFLGELLARARREGHALANAIASVSLFAPACTQAFFDKHWTPLVRTGTDIALYNMTDQAEQDDTVGALYRKSLLYLVSNALEEVDGAPLTGMAKHAKQRRGVTLHYTQGEKTVPTFPKSLGSTDNHGGFDNDPAIMNHMLARVLGSTPETLRHTGFSQDELAGGF